MITMAKDEDNSPPSAIGLLDNPDFDYSMFESGGGGGASSPFDQAFGALTTTGGPKLELLTRANKKLSVAIDHTYNRCFNYHSLYLRGRIDMLMRLAVSMGGKGRGEIVDSLKAGSGVPDSFYSEGANDYTPAFSEAPVEDDEMRDED